MNKKYTTTSLALLLSAFSLASAASPDNSSKIINGTQSVKGDWPFMSALIRKNMTADTGQFCGASFIGGRYVLTASHCVVRKAPGDIDVSVGIHDLFKENTEGQRVGVQAIYMHEDYDQFTLTNDIAILELDQEITASSVELATNTLANSLAAGNTLTVMGWGNTSTTDNSFPAILRQVDVPYVDRSTCQNIGGDYSTVGDDAICAGLQEGGKDSCQGDSGGPLVYNDNGTYKQVGIVSWGVGCAQPNTYGVYSNVGYFNQGWIAEKTDGVSYTQNTYITNTKAEDLSIQLPIRNYSSESFDITNVVLPEGFARTPGTCTSTTLTKGSSCQLTLLIDVAAATNAITDTTTETTTNSEGQAINRVTKKASITVTTDHSVSSELKMNVSFISTSLVESTKSSGGASIGLGLLAIFSFWRRRRGLTHA